MMAAGPFSRDATRELRDCLGPKADDIIADLHEVLAAYPDAKVFVEQDFYQQWTRGIGWLRSLSTALQAAQHELETYDPQPEWRNGLDELEAQVAAHLATVEYVYELPDASTRGRRRNEPRRWLANMVGYVLHHHGVPLGRTHTGGPFHTVLRRVIEAAENKMAPEDLFDLVQETADMFLAITPQQLDAMDIRLIGLLRPRRIRRLP
jgi:hypothetical protein